MRRRAAARAWLAALLLAPAAGAEPPRGDPAARLLPSEHASDVWDLTVRLEGGHWVVARATITNLGPGDRTGAVTGHVVDPEGGTHEFHKVRREGAWELSADRRRLDLDAIILDQSRQPARLYVSKKRVDLDLHVDLSGEPAWPDGPGPAGAGLDLLALGAPVEGTLRVRDGGVRPVRGRAILTHRWAAELEARRVDRRVELFALGDGPAVYFVEVTPPEGPAFRWLVAGGEGRIWHAEHAVEARYEAEAGGGTLELASPGVTGRARLAGVVLRDEPLGRLPWLVRWWYARWTRPRFVWSDAPFEFAVRRPGGGEAVRVAGRGLVDVARFDSDGAAPPEGTAGWGER